MCGGISQEKRNSVDTIHGIHRRISRAVVAGRAAGRAAACLFGRQAEGAIGRCARVRRRAIKHKR